MPEARGGCAMTACREVRELMSCSLDLALSPIDQDRLDAHLAQCLECQAYLEELRWTLSRIKAVDPVEPPPWLASKIMARIRAEPEPRPAFWRRVLLPLVRNPQVQVASLLLVGATGYYLYKTQRAAAEFQGDLDSFRRSPAATAEAPSPAPTPAPAPGDTPGKLATEATKAATKAAPPLGQEVRPDGLKPPQADAQQKLQPEPERQQRGLEDVQAQLAFAPPPPSVARKEAAKEVQKRDMAPSSLAGAATGGPAPAPPQAPAPGASTLAASKNEAEGGRAREAKKAASAEERMVQQDADSAGRLGESAAGSRLIRLEMEDPGTAAALIERELARAGGTVLPQSRKDGRRQVTARLDARRIPDLLRRLQRMGRLLESQGGTDDTPSQVVLVIRW